MTPAATVAPAGVLEKALRDRRDAGRKLLVPYVTGGLGRDWLEVVRAVAAAGADAIEIGIPFSDPVMDGPGHPAGLGRGAAAPGRPRRGSSPPWHGRTPGVPLAVMTYYNIVLRAGHRRMARTLAEAGVSGAIVPDLPIDELDGWGDEAGQRRGRDRAAGRADNAGASLEGDLRPVAGFRLRRRRAWG